MDKVRFTVGDAHVWQGFHTVGDNGMIGALVYVTADTLRAVTDHFHDNVLSTEWDRVHNGPSEDWETLAFGDAGTIVSPLDGITPLYRLTFAEAVIVQRFDPTMGRTYDRHLDSGNIEKVPMGAWVNEDTIDGFEQPFADAGFTPVTHGFYIDPQDVAEGRSNAPLIDTEYAKAQRDGHDYVVDVLVPVAIAVHADNEEQAASMAVLAAKRQGVIERIEALVDTDDSDFTISDSEIQTEVGEA
jgi:hypothetical protein